jgi:hypothetical protein
MIESIIDFESCSRTSSARAVHEQCTSSERAVHEQCSWALHEQCSSISISISISMEQPLSISISISMIDSMIGSCTVEHGHQEQYLWPFSFYSSSIFRPHLIVFTLKQSSVIHDPRQKIWDSTVRRRDTMISHPSSMLEDFGIINLRMTFNMCGPLFFKNGTAG